MRNESRYELGVTPQGGKKQMEMQLVVCWYSHYIFDVHIPSVVSNILKSFTSTTILILCK